MLREGWTIRSRLFYSIDYYVPDYVDQIMKNKNSLQLLEKAAPISMWMLGMLCVEVGELKQRLAGLL